MTHRYAYGDYGVPRLHDGAEHAPGAGFGIGDLERNPYGYAGEYTHGDGSQFLRERIYQPALMSFTSQDAESLHNVYGYANANPIMMVDPSGRDAVKDWFAVGLTAYGAVAAAFGVMAIATGGIGLGAFGVIGTLFGIGDAVFTAVEAWAVATDTKFMPDDAALGIGVGLAVMGTAFGVGGLLTSWTTSAGSKQFRAIARNHLGDGTPPTVLPGEGLQKFTVVPGSSNTGLSPLIERLAGPANGGGKAGVWQELRTFAGKVPPDSRARHHIDEAINSLDTALDELGHLVKYTTGTLDGLRERIRFNLANVGKNHLQPRVDAAQNAVERAMYSMNDARKEWLFAEHGLYFKENVKTDYDAVIGALDEISEGLLSLKRYT